MVLTYNESIALEAVMYQNSLNLQTYWFEFGTKIFIMIFLFALILAFFYWAHRVGEGKKILDGRATEVAVVTPMHVVFALYLKLWAFIFIIVEFLVLLTLGGRIELMSVFVTLLFLFLAFMLSGIYFFFHFGIRNISLIMGFDKHLIHKARKMKGRLRR